MFREIRTREIITEEDERRREREQNYLKIKPEKEMSLDEINSFWNQIFMEAHEEAVRNNV